ncbi:MAG: threonylcarbamoyl-AMP synthase [Bacteroidetes bacterium]|nr:threonylcarbamoyl-AMP synthase [Bacteroidota bacterium]
METLYLTTDPSTRTRSIQTAARLLREGHIVAFPTETVYGLGANAFDEEAVLRVFAVKGRPRDNPMIVHVHHPRQARELMQEVPDLFGELVNEFWPGPLTLIVRHNAAVPDVVTAGLETVAVRMPDLKITRNLLCQTGVPVAAPSANLSGRPSPTDASSVFADLQGKISAVLDGGECPVGIESTVLDLTSAIPTILRPGTVTREDLEDVIQSRVLFADANAERPLSPGMKYRHYAPQASLVVVSPQHAESASVLADAVAKQLSAGKRVGLLAPEAMQGMGEAAFFSLGDGTPVEYARRIYAGLRALDAEGVGVILCPGIAAEGIGVAVMNRLLKAAEREI